MLDASTFTDNDVINLANEHFINLKINAETDYGRELFNQFNGAGYPLIVFLDQDGIEIDRFAGYMPAYEFINKMNDVLSGENILSSYLEQYNQGNHTAELVKKLADKYKDKGEYKVALRYYQELAKTANLSLSDFNVAKYHIASLSLKENNADLIIEYLEQYKESKYFEDATYDLIDYYKANQMEFEELSIYKLYLQYFMENSNFLNTYAWRMTELNRNLDDALDKVNLSLSLIDEAHQMYPMIVDTKAEILWKLDQIDEAIEVIDKAILLDSESQYYKAQKEKFLNSNL
jgi:tetratricopeptide (TPR) repeat protein